MPEKVIYFRNNPLLFDLKSPSFTNSATLQLDLDEFRSNLSEELSCKDIRE